MKKNVVPRVLLALTLLLASGSDFAAASSPVGRWKGSWSSAGSGHRGALRARIRATDQGAYKVLFAGRFAVVIPFVYRTELTPIPGIPGQFTSSKKLPLMGTYRMQATVVGNDFHATFSGGRDQGVFRMRRR